MSSLTIRLDKEMNDSLKRLARERGRTKSELVREMLRRQVAVEAFEEARRRILPLAEKAGYLTDEDVFRDFS